MIRQYSNGKIYRNLKIVKILSIVAIILSMIAIISYTCYKYINNPNAGIELNQVLFYLLAFFVPILMRSMTIEAQKSVSIYLKGESKRNNDFNNTIVMIGSPLFPFILLIFFLPFEAIFDNIGNSASWVYYCGYMLFPHLSIYIADVFLIHNCILIKREWKDNPPGFAKIRQEKKNKRNKERAYKQNIECHKSLIEKCGMKFFIKYYKQIKQLPLRDVNVTESYSNIEREERLFSAKKIIDSNLTEFTLKTILNMYSDILDKADIEQAKSLLSELQITEKNFKTLSR